MSPQSSGITIITIMLYHCVTCMSSIMSTVNSLMFARDLFGEFRDHF